MEIVILTFRSGMGIPEKEGGIMNKITMGLIIVVLLASTAQAAEIKYPSNLWQGLIAEDVEDGARGMFGVACVVRNRLEKGMDCGLTGLRRHDLSVFVARQGKDAEIMARAIVYWVMERKAPDTTRGALHFESIRFRKPWWARHKRIVARIGHQDYYK
jgi:hypothetical protein